ncbi:MAG: hypothetical protein JSS61_04690 [Verrucomicrobia bacterium]|nr:hypothetical protein [Verrucomicrobiota bacterium]
MSDNCIHLNVSVLGKRGHDELYSDFDALYNPVTSHGTDSAVSRVATRALQDESEPAGKRLSIGSSSSSSSAPSAPSEMTLTALAHQLLELASAGNALETQTYSLGAHVITEPLLVQALRKRDELLACKGSVKDKNKLKKCLANIINEIGNYYFKIKFGCNYKAVPFYSPKNTEPVGAHAYGLALQQFAIAVLSGDRPNESLKTIEAFCKGVSSLGQASSLDWHSSLKAAFEKDFSDVHDPRRHNMALRAEMASLPKLQFGTTYLGASLQGHAHEKFYIEVAISYFAFALDALFFSDRLRGSAALRTQAVDNWIRFAREHMETALNNEALKQRMPEQYWKLSYLYWTFHGTLTSA